MTRAPTRRAQTGRALTRALQAFSVAVCVLGGPAAWGESTDSTSPGDFLPGGMLGLQIGSSWDEAWKSPLLERTSCRRFDARHDDIGRAGGARAAAVSDFDEVCFFHTASRVAGAKIHDPFVVRHRDRVVAIGTGIRIKDVDDPVAEAVMRQFQTQIHARFEQNGDGVWFVNLPEKPLTRSELDGFSKTAPVLLVQVGGRGRELSVLYGYLAPVNAFIAAQSD